jgi:subtilisin family serine protease
VQGKIQTTILPRAVDKTPVTVVAVLTGPSVADLQSAAQRKLTRDEKNTVKAARVAEQASPRASITAMGGQVIGSFQSALNGIKVRIPRDQVDSLRSIPGVIDIKPVKQYTYENFVSVQRIQAPFAWAGAAGVHGEGIKIGIIDTGIDYTHANFGGPGTVAAFNTAFAANTTPADPALFGPSAPKVKGGTDLVGDAYNAAGAGAALTPVPDPNPLDCAGHGSHVAGTAAGYGVLSDGTTYHGPYDQLTHSTHSFGIGPGVAPMADLYAIRVFGCAGSTDVITEALDWAVDNDMDVVNMSLGAAFGPPDSSDAIASDNAVKAGVVVVSAAGNDGDFRYILSSPGSSTLGLAVASTATPATLPTANIPLAAAGGDTARTITGINANGAPLPTGTLPILVLKTGTAVSLGCTPAEYTAQGAAGKIVVTQRGICARVARAIFGQQAGALAVVMINNTTDLPPQEGPITSNPDTGIPFNVTIPFIGVAGTVTTPGSAGSLLALRNGTTTSLTDGTPIKTGTSSFSSGGPRIGDSALKPDIAAPGEAVISTLIGSGTGSEALSGTSMATPHVAGTAALAIQAHPKWKPAAIKSAIINSGDPDQLADYVTHRAGTGLINAGSVAGTQAYAYADRNATTLNFGLEQFQSDLTETSTIHVHNDAQISATFNVGVVHKNGSPHSVSFSASQITVPARSDATVDVTVTVPAATAGDSSAFRDVAGLVTFTPTSATSNRGIALKVPYFMVPRVSSNVATELPKLKGTVPSAFATVSNDSAAIAATADFYAWGLSSPNAQLGTVDLRAAGVQAFDNGGDQTLVFAVNTFNGWSTPEAQEFDVLIDSDGDGNPDFDVFTEDLGLLTTGTRNGQLAAAILDLASGAVSIDFLASASTDSSTVLLPVVAASVGITPANPRLSYTVQSFDLLSSNTDGFTSSASFNAFTSAVSNGQFVEVAPNTIAPVAVSVDKAEFALTPALGLMVVTQDNKNGAGEADLVKVKF